MTRTLRILPLYHAHIAPAVPTQVDLSSAEARAAGTIAPIFAMKISTTFVKGP